MTGRLESAVAALRQAHAAAHEVDAPPSEMWDADDGLYRVLREINAGTYAPTREDAKAVLELAADGAAFGWQANELHGLIRAGLRAL